MVKSGKMKGWTDVTEEKGSDYKPDNGYDYGINEFQIERCARILGKYLTEEDIKKFDIFEPEWHVILELKDMISEPALMNLLAGASIINYQLGTGEDGVRGAEAYWPALLDTVKNQAYDVETPEGSYKALKYFLNNYKVNNRIRNNRNTRLDKWYDNGFSEWIFENYERNDLERVWYELAKSVENEMYKKTIMVGVKQFDLAYMAYTGDYYDFEVKQPLAIDIQVRIISAMMGIIPNDEPTYKINKSARLGCQKFIDKFDELMDTTITPFRLDSILFQLGREVFWTKPRKQNIYAVSDYFRKITGLEEDKAMEIGGIYTTGQRDDIELKFNMDIVDEFDEKLEFKELKQRFEDG